MFLSVLCLLYVPMYLLTAYYVYLPSCILSLLMHQCLKCMRMCMHTNVYWYEHLYKCVYFACIFYVRVYICELNRLNFLRVLFMHESA